MNLHEYQGKQILKSFGVKIQEGIPVKTVEEAIEAAKKLHAETGTGIGLLKHKFMPVAGVKAVALK